jgi:cell division protein FtsZ
MEQNLAIEGILNNNVLEEENKIEKEVKQKPTEKEKEEYRKEIFKSMKENLNEVKEKEITIPQAKIKVVGVGGGGGNMIAHMLKKAYPDIELIIVNTDAQVLQGIQTNKQVNTIQIGMELTKGLGAGMKPEIGEASAKENEKELQKILNGADIVFIATGLGGGTGTGAAPVVAKIAKDLGALTVSVVTKPFLFEGRKRAKLAKEGLDKLKEESDSIVVIPNDKLLKIIDKKMGVKESFKMVDEVLSQAVIGTSGIILSTGNNDINLDFADLKTVLTHKGTALMGIGEYTGDDAAVIAIKQAIKSPLLDDISIDGAMGILVHFETHPNYAMLDLSEAMNIAENTADENADVIFGTSTNKDLDENYVKVTLIATGFEKFEKGNNKKGKIIGKITMEDFLELPTYLRHQ